MNEVDKKVLELFRILIFGETNFYSHKHPYGGMVFEVGETSILLQWFGKSKNSKTTNSPIKFEDFKHSFFPTAYEICIPSETGIEFYLTIGEHRKQLVVPPLSRIEEAQVKDRIEFLVNNKIDLDLDVVIDFAKTSNL